MRSITQRGGGDVGCAAKRVEDVEQVADHAVALAAQVGRPGLVAFFAQAGPRGIAALCERPADGLLLWPASGVTTWGEATRIVLLESTVHLLDGFDALGRAPDVPAAALRETAHLLADLADPVAFVEAATGRSSSSPLPVLR